MKLYRVALYCDTGVSAGYEYFGTKKDALRKVREEKDPNGMDDAVMEEINVTPTKTGILAALNRYGDHPDNG